MDDQFYCDACGYSSIINFEFLTCVSSLMLVDVVHLIVRWQLAALHEYLGIEIQAYVLPYHS